MNLIHQAFRRLKDEGKRFTIPHAGTASGLLESDLMLGSNTEHRDYHKNMNAKIFTEWIYKELLPAMNSFNKTCVIILDNAPYHSEHLEKWSSSRKTRGSMNKNKHLLIIYICLFLLIESMYFYLLLIQVKAFANGLCI
jgi:hypothetical protein